MLLKLLLALTRHGWCCGDTSLEIQGERGRLSTIYNLLLKILVEQIHDKVPENISDNECQPLNNIGSSLEYWQFYGIRKIGPHELSEYLKCRYLILFDAAFSK